jgi:hypothetical protein
MIELSFKEIKHSDLRKFRQEIWNNRELCLTSPIEELGKLFFKKLIDNNIFDKYQFQEIRTKYIKDLHYEQSKAIVNNIEVDLPKIPEKEKDFFAYICKRYLGFKKEPRLCLLDLYQNAAEDIREIDERINKYKEHIENEQNKKSESTDNDGDGYTKALIEHYIKVNKDAKNQIISFITSEDIKICAIEESSKSTIFPQNPYTYSYREEYRYQPSRYNKEKLSKIANKFLDITCQELKDLEILHKNGDPEFYEYAHEYISDRNIVVKIKEYIQKNHFLKARENILNPILNFYEQNEFLLFLNLTPLQIEGIFHDYCIGLGVSKELLKKASIGQKLDEIVKKNPNLQDFEYFKFIFPNTRNRVAHGKLVNNLEEAREISCLLVLDLHDVCNRITTDNNIPINLMVDILKKIKDGETSNENLLKLEYGYIKNLDIPDFYNLAEEKQLAKEKCNKDSFFQYLDDTITKSNNIYFIGTIEKIVNSLKKQSIQVSLCSKLLIDINHHNRKPGKFDLDFIKFCDFCDEECDRYLGVGS